MCNGHWRGTADLLIRLREMTELLTNPSDLTSDEKRAALEEGLGNLLGIVDWFEWANQLTVDPQRVEAEFDRYDEATDAVTTQRQGPFE